MDALLHVSEDRDSDGAAAWHFAGGDCDVCPSPVMLVFGRLISSGGRYLNTNVLIELIMMAWLIIAIDGVVAWPDDGQTDRPKCNAARERTSEGHCLQQHTCRSTNFLERTIGKEGVQ